jgi:hypothetical protein
MNKRTIVASLNKIANELDNSGLYREATSLTNVMRKIADKPLFMEDDEPMFGKGEFFPDEEMTPKSPKPQLSGGGAGQPPKPPFFDSFEEDEDLINDKEIIPDLIKNKKDNKDYPIMEEEDILSSYDY